MNWNPEQNGRKKIHTILIAAKCLISVTQNYNWEMKRKTWFEWYDNVIVEHKKKKTQQNAVVIFHLVRWNIVRCICAINHLVSAMIHTQPAIVHLLRLFVTMRLHWIPNEIYALPFSTLILPNFFHFPFLFFSIFVVSYVKEEAKPTEK